MSYKIDEIEGIGPAFAQKLQGAQIKLNPAQLGPMEVRIQMQHDQASIQFTSAHAVVRDALEAALPRLRDMFESAGVQLVNVDVSGQSIAHQQAAPEGREPPAWKRFAGAGEDGGVALMERPAAVAETPRAGINGIDCKSAAFNRGSRA